MLLDVLRFASISFGAAENVQSVCLMISRAQHSLVDDGISLPDFFFDVSEATRGRQCDREQIIFSITKPSTLTIHIVTSSCGRWIRPKAFYFLEKISAADLKITQTFPFHSSLFTRHPQYQKYFSFRDVPVSKLKHDKRLKAHAYGAFLALQEIVENLENTEKLIDLLSSLGEDHSKRNIPKQAFWVFINTKYKYLFEIL